MASTVLFYSLNVYLVCIYISIGRMAPSPYPLKPKFYVAFSPFANIAATIQGSEL